MSSDNSNNSKPPAVERPQAPPRPGSTKRNFARTPITPPPIPKYISPTAATPLSSHSSTLTPAAQSQTVPETHSSQYQQSASEKSATPKPKARYSTMQLWGDAIRERLQESSSPPPKPATKTTLEQLVQKHKSKTPTQKMWSNRVQSTAPKSTTTESSFFERYPVEITMIVTPNPEGSTLTAYVSYTHLKRFYGYKVLKNSRPFKEVPNLEAIFTCSSWLIADAELKALHPEYKFNSTQQQQFSEDLARATAENLFQVQKYYDEDSNYNFMPAFEKIKIFREKIDDVIASYLYESTAVQEKPNLTNNAEIMTSLYKIMFIIASTDAQVYEIINQFDHALQEYIKTANEYLEENQETKKTYVVCALEEIEEKLTARYVQHD